MTDIRALAEETRRQVEAAGLNPIELDMVYKTTRRFVDEYHSKPITPQELCDFIVGLCQPTDSYWDPQFPF